MSLRISRSINGKLFLAAINRNSVRNAGNCFGKSLRNVTSSSTPTSTYENAPKTSVTAYTPTSNSTENVTGLTSQPLSLPTLSRIEKRWSDMPPPEQAELWMQLRDRMREPWQSLTLAEKRAAYWIAFGPHGPRAELSAPGDSWKVARYTLYGVIVSAIVFAFIRSFAKPPPHTLTEEYKRATDELLKAQNAEPLSNGVRYSSSDD